MYQRETKSPAPEVLKQIKLQDNREYSNNKNIVVRVKEWLAHSLCTTFNKCAFKSLSSSLTSSNISIIFAL
jgi:hypothetical protein